MGDKINLRALLDSASAILASRIIGLAVSFATVPMIARALGPEGRGESAAAVSFLILLPVLLAYGVPIYTRRVFAQGTDAQAALRAVRILALIASLVGWVLAHALVDLLLPNIGPEDRGAFLIGAPVCVFFGIIWICNGGVLVGQGRRLRYAIVSLLPTVFLGLIVLGLFVNGILTVSTVVYAQATSYVLVGVVSHWLTDVPLFGPTMGLKELLRRSGRYAWAQVAQSASFRADQALVVPVIGAHAAGQYSVAATISMLPIAFGQAVAAASFGQASLEAEGPEAQARAALLLRLSVWVSLGSSALVGALTPFVVPLLFGVEFREAILATWIGLSGVAALVVGQSADTLLVVYGKGSQLARAQVAGLVLGLVGLLVLGLEFGLYGASAASSMGFLITAALMIYSTDVPARELIPRRSDAGALLSLFKRGHY